ncbi:MAG: hypothetical protein ACKO39_03910, partial [Chthoniobacterales bacterium]
MNNKKFSLGLVALLLIAGIVALAALSIPQPAAKSDQAKNHAADASLPDASLADTADTPASVGPAIANASSSTAP